MKSHQLAITLVSFGIIFIFFSMLPTGTLMAQAVSIYVDDDNTTGSEDGTSQYPYNSIQEAVTAAENTGDTLKVAAGTYAGNIIVQDKTVLIFGGYAGGTTSNYSNGDGGNFSERNPTANTTHIQGNGTDAVVTMNEAGNSSLDGFRITGGTGNTEALPWFYAGGGIHVSGGSPTISNNIIEDNDTRHSGADPGFESQGGGIHASEANISIINNIIRNNFSGFGAGIAIEGGSVVIRGNTVQGNIAINDHGGGLWIAAPTVEISENLVLNNEVGRTLGYGNGGGILVFGVGTSATLSYNVVSGNYAPSYGAGEFVDEGAEAILDHELIYRNVCEPDEVIGGCGMYVDGGEDDEGQVVGSRATILHCTVVNNPGNGQAVGNGLLVENLSEVTVKNSIFWGNNGDDFWVDNGSTLTVTFTNSEEAISGVGNVSSDPLFANTSTDDYHLQSSNGRWDPSANGGNGAWVVDDNHSPCIDAGDPASDYSNETTPNGDRVNMGVYGNTAEASKSAAPVSVLGEEVEQPQRFTMYQNFPNPFNPTTIIQYELPRGEEVKISIYNIQGQEIRMLIDEYQDAGFYTVLWDGKDQRSQPVVSGVYVYQIQAGQFAQVRKMILSR